MASSDNISLSSTIINFVDKDDEGHSRRIQKQNGAEGNANEHIHGAAMLQASWKESKTNALSNREVNKFFKFLTTKVKYGVNSYQEILTTWANLLASWHMTRIHMQFIASECALPIAT